MESFMNVSGYSADDLTFFSSVLDAAAAEAAERDLHLPMSLMTRRLFEAASWGERNADRLRAEILGDTLHSALARSPERRPELGQSLGLPMQHPVWARRTPAASLRRMQSA